MKQTPAYIYTNVSHLFNQCTYNRPRQGKPQMPYEVPVPSLWLNLEYHCCKQFMCFQIPRTIHSRANSSCRRQEIFFLYQYSYSVPTSQSYPRYAYLDIQHYLSPTPGSYQRPCKPSGHSGIDLGIKYTLDQCPEEVIKKSDE